MSVINVSVNNFFAYVSHVRLLLYSIVPYLSRSWRCGFLFRWRGASGLQHVQLHPAEFKGKTALHGVSPLSFLYIVVHVHRFLPLTCAKCVSESTQNPFRIWFRALGGETKVCQTMRVFVALNPLPYIILGVYFFFKSQIILILF
jgi:hypothetical protein